MLAPFPYYSELKENFQTLVPPSGPPLPLSVSFRAGLCFEQHVFHFMYSADTCPSLQLNQATDVNTRSQQM